MDLEHARERIRDEQSRIGDLVHQVRSDLQPSDEGPSNLTEADPQPGEAGGDTFEREKDFSILEELEAELAELEAALARIDEGTYGVDEVTGDPIDRERLEVLPAARTNIEPERT